MYADIVRRLQGMGIGTTDREIKILDGIDCFGGGETVKKCVSFADGAKRACDSTRQTRCP